MGERAETSVLASRVFWQVLRRLIDGDPVMWTTVVAVGVIAWVGIKTWMNKGPNQDSRPTAEHRQTEGDAGRRS
jgi:hypothetical protein